MSRLGRSQQLFKRWTHPHLRDIADRAYDLSGTPAFAVLAVPSHSMDIIETREDFVFTRPPGPRGRTVCPEPRQRLLRKVEAPFYYDSQD